jgi:hypothetical protein
VRVRQHVGHAHRAHVIQKTSLHLSDYRDVRIDYTATDACGPATVTLRVRSDQDRRCHADDATVVDPNLVRLRAERRRTYTVTVEAVDAKRNRASGKVTVAVTR